MRPSEENAFTLVPTYFARCPGYNGDEGSSLRLRSGSSVNAWMEILLRLAKMVTCDLALGLDSVQQLRYKGLGSESKSCIQYRDKNGI